MKSLQFEHKQHPLFQFVAYPYIPGSGSGAFQGISVFIGVLFSLDSSAFIANVVAGYSMTYRRAFKKVTEFRLMHLLDLLKSKV